MPDIRTGYAPVLARGAEDESSKSGHSLILCNTDDLYVKADYHADRLIGHNVSGVVFVPTAAEDHKNHQIVEKFTNKQIPVVLADRSIRGENIDQVTSDNFNGAYKLTKYLIQNNHTRIAITLSDRFSTERDRFAGYKKALEDYNIPLDPTIIKIFSGPYAEKPYEQYARTLLKQKNSVTAIFAGYDRIAYVIYSVAEEMNVSIPNDISLVGYDDLQPTCGHTVSLTTVHQPIYEIGQESMKLVMKRINGSTQKPQKIVLKSKLIERDSVSKINSNGVLNEPELATEEL